MANSTTHPFENLSWYRLRITLLCIRMVPGYNTPPVRRFQSVVKDVTESFGPEDHNIIFHLCNPRQYRGYRENEQICIEVLFCRHSLSYVTAWRRALQHYMDAPKGGKNLRLLDCSAPEQRSYRMLAERYAGLPVTGELCIEFITPLPVKHTKCDLRKFLEPTEFLELLLNRFKLLFDKNICYEISGSGLHLRPCDHWHYDTRWKFETKSQSGVKILGGGIGKLYLCGNFEPYVPLLILGSELHCGGKRTFAQGVYRIIYPPPV